MKHTKIDLPTNDPKDETISTSSKPNGQEQGSNLVSFSISNEAFIVFIIVICVLIVLLMIFMYKCAEYRAKLLHQQQQYNYNASQAQKQLQLAKVKSLNENELQLEMGQHSESHSADHQKEGSNCNDQDRKKTSFTNKFVRRTVCDDRQQITGHKLARIRSSSTKSKQMHLLNHDQEKQRIIQH